jgi:hypothetical protein
MSDTWEVSDIFIPFCAKLNCIVTKFIKQHHRKRDNIRKSIIILTKRHENFIFIHSEENELCLESQDENI